MESIHKKTKPKRYAHLYVHMPELQIAGPSVKIEPQQLMLLR